MRIICWNMNGHIDELRLGVLLMAWHPDVLILLEPSGRLKERAGKFVRMQKTDSRGYEDTPYTLGLLPDHDAQGDVMYASSAGVLVVPKAISEYEPERLSLERQLAILTIIKGGASGDERIVVATCHAPYGSGVASEASGYCGKVRRILNAMILKGMSVDVWMGDLNVYGGVPVDGDSESGGRRRKLSTSGPSHFQRCPLGGTSGFKGGENHSPLDQIHYRTGFPMGQFGRIVPANEKPNLGDEVYAPWTRHREILSDHLPIYFDTKTGSSSSTAATSTGTTTSTTGTPASFSFPTETPDSRKKAKPTPPPGSTGSG